MAPQAFGRYEIRAEIGRGGMATVYQAYDPHFRREVAIKVLPREFLHDQTFRARFAREAQIIAGLEHPAIVPVYDFGEEDGQPYLIMGLMSGGSLASRIQQGPLSLDEAVRIIDRIAPALDEAHMAGMIHRDIKPANILFDKRGKAYLSDFGIVKVTEATAQLTGSGMIGTPAYMAPEVARAGGLTSLVDVYALGVTLFQMLTGHLPYQADTPLGVIMAHATQPVPSLCDFRPDLPEQLQQVIDHAMAKDPMERVPTASALAQELKTVVQACTTQELIDTVTEEAGQTMRVATPGAAQTSSMPVPAEARTEPVADMFPTPVEARTVPDMPATPVEQRPTLGQGHPEKKSAFPILIAIVGGVVVVGLVIGILALSGALSGKPTPTPTQAVAASTQAPAAPTQAPPIQVPPTLAPTPAGPKKSYADLVVCYVQVGTAGNTWLAALTTSIKQTAQSVGIKRLIFSEYPQQENQVRAIRDCIAQKVDVIGLNPAVETGWEGIFTEARDAGIPIVLGSNRAQVVEDMYASYIGSDFESEGYKAGTEMAERLNGEGNVVEITGGASAAADRAMGFRAALHDDPNIKIIGSKPGDWSFEGGRNAMAAFLKQGNPIQGVFAQNDQMALGAIQAIEASGLKPGVDIKIVSIDGYRTAFNAMIAGKLNATIECNPMIGPQFFETILKVVNKEPVDKWVKTNEGVYPQETAAKELPNRKY